MKQAHREASDLEALAAAPEHRNVTRIRDESDRPIDVRAIDALDCAAKIVKCAREPIDVRVHESSLCSMAPQRV
jgi:hypothetical protein